MNNFQNLSYYDKVTYVVEYITVVEASIGIVSNTFVFIVLSRKSLNRYSFSFYNRARVISDMIVLLFIYRDFASVILGENLSLTSGIMCKLGEYGPWVSASVSIWLLAVTALDRLVTIVFPTRFKFLQSKSIQAAVVVFITVYGVFLHIPMILYTQLTYVNETNVTGSYYTCQIDEPSEAQLSYWIILVDQMIVVFVINNLLAIVIIYTIYKSRAKFKIGQNQNENKRALRDRKFAINSIVLNVKCFVLKTPLLIVTLISTYLTDVAPDELNMYFYVSIALYILDSCCVLFINLTVNRLFLNEFVLLFKSNKVDVLNNANTTQPTQTSIYFVHYRNFLFKKQTNILSNFFLFKGNNTEK